MSLRKWKQLESIIMIFMSFQFLDEPGCNTTILTGLKVLEDADWGPRRSTDHPKVEC
jgi:hypothetical protein